MTTLQSVQKAPTSASKSTLKRYSPIPSDSKSFEEIYKTSYSHGLEAIYALENVDLRSVKRIEAPSKTVLKKVEKKKNSTSPLQQELDLGEEFRGWMASFVKKEPIQVLELSKHAEKCLIENGMSRIEDLIGVNLQKFVLLRGIGQGHLEEIQQKLNAYVEGKNLDKCHQVDFASWLKSLLGAQERKKAFSFLETYDLTDLIALTPGEHAEVRKLTFEKREEWEEELLGKITQPSQKMAVWSDMQHIFNVFFKPWIRQRGGFADKKELQERMQRISLDSRIYLNVLQVLECVYFDNEDIFTLFLKKIDDDLYCSDAFCVEDYEKIISQARTYFYKSTIYYPLDQLIGMMERELSKSWMGYKEGTIEKILRLSPAFQIVKGKSGHLEIYL